MKLPLVISVPHAGTRVPEEVRAYCRLAPGDVAADGDEGAAQVYDLEDEVAAFVTTDVARAIVDLNRAEDDRGADGVVKTHTCLGVAVYDPFPPEDVVVGLLSRYHRPYHGRLSRIAGSGVVLGVDCHTMLAVGPEMGPLPGQRRPLLCLSNVDGRSCAPEWLLRMAGCLRRSFGFEPALNDPFKGGYITRAHAAELAWMQLEISREPFLSHEEKKERVRDALREFCEGLA